MQFEWDTAKNETNQSKHGLGFERAYDMDWDHALVVATQVENGEMRDLIVAPLFDRLAAIVTTDRDHIIRVISLRHATKHEITLWRQEYHG